jgi:hypothetical protein
MANDPGRVEALEVEMERRCKMQAEKEAQRGERTTKFLEE